MHVPKAPTCSPPQSDLEDATATAPFVSVIVPVLDTDKLGPCLEALARQTYPRYEVIVVDNGAPAGAVEGLLPDRERFRLEREERRGSYAARNAGLRAARGGVLAFTDADCVPADDWIERGVQALAANPGCGLVGGHVDVTVVHAAHPSAAELYDVHTNFRQREYVERHSFAATANMFTRRDVFERVGPFDAELLSLGDREWGTRVGAAGLPLVYAPSARVEHPARFTWTELAARTARTTGGFLRLIGRKRWTLWKIVKDVPIGLLPIAVTHHRSARHKISKYHALKLYSASTFVLAVRVVETVRLLCGRDPVSR